MYLFTPTTSEAANDFLRRAAQHLATLASGQREEWFELFIPTIKAWPLSRQVNAFEKSLVIATLQRWSNFCKERAP
jgi:hypothetical protein